MNEALTSVGQHIVQLRNDHRNSTPNHTKCFTCSAIHDARNAYLELVAILSEAEARTHHTPETFSPYHRYRLVETTTDDNSRTTLHWRCLWCNAVIRTDRGHGPQIRACERVIRS